MKKVTFFLIGITLSTKLLGFLKDIVLSFFYGATEISDAYLISLTIPMFIVAFIGTGVTTSFIPIYNQLKKNEGESSSINFTNNVVNILLAVCGILFIFSFIFTPVIVKIFASGFFGETLDQAIIFTRISLISVFFTGLYFLFSGYLQVNGNYLVPAIAAVPMNLIIIISIYYSYNKNLLLLPVGTVIAMFIQLLTLLPYIRRKNYKYRFTINLKDENVISLVYLLLPVVIGASVNQINVLVDRTIASQIVPGAISALTYAKKLDFFITSIFVTSIATVVYPAMTSKIIDGDKKSFIKLVLETIIAICFIVLPISVGAMIFSTPIITMLFGRGAFDQQAVKMTSDALFFYSIGMLFVGLREIIARGLYSLQDTKTPMINASIGMLLNIILNIILSKLLGIGGLALATSIAAIFTTFLLIISLRKKIGPFGMKQISVSFLKILSASLVMGALAKLSFNYLTTSLSQNLSLFLAIGVGAISYFVIIYFMKIEELDAIVTAFKK